MGTYSKDQRDIYHRLAKEQGYRARSAYKLIQINEHFDIIKEDMVAVDLCAAPGSWTDILAKKCRKVISVDIQQMYPVENTISIIGDITTESCRSSVLSSIREHSKNACAEADLVVCDGAPDTTGMTDYDVFVQHKIVLSALELAKQVLKVGSAFVGKLYRMNGADNVIRKFMEAFESVDLVKPRSSRLRSIECFIVARKKRKEPIILDRGFRPILQCISVGNGPDPDVNTAIEKTASRKHLFPPISPPYKKAIEMRRKNK